MIWRQLEFANEECPLDARSREATRLLLRPVWFYSKRLTSHVMITSIHTLIYSDDAQATRAFLRDVLGWKYVAEDWDNDWLIFKSGPSEMGVHPTHSVWEGKTYDHPRQHSIALMCDDIEATVEELRAKGAQFRGPIEEHEYGRVIMVIVPGADDMQLYQPTHKLAYNLENNR
jgi:catechol 2,3-dioxygenase-like lactoylglutathione lyase family enzyme